jgi:hypothetical protein
MIFPLPGLPLQNILHAACLLASFLACLLACYVIPARVNIFSIVKEHKFPVTYWLVP